MMVASKAFWQTTYESAWWRQVHQAVTEFYRVYVTLDSGTNTGQISDLTEQMNRAYSAVKLAPYIEAEHEARSHVLHAMAHTMLSLYATFDGDKQLRQYHIQQAVWHFQRLDTLSCG